MALNSLNIATLGVWHLDSIGLGMLGLWSPDGGVSPPPPPPPPPPYPHGKVPRRHKKPIGFEILKPGEHYDPFAEEPKKRKTLKAPVKALKRYEDIKIDIAAYMDNPPGTVVVMPRKPDIAARRRRLMVVLFASE